jgi:hypothetical protein
MRTYDIPVNAELMEVVCSADTVHSAEGFILYYDLIATLHTILAIEYIYLVSGGMRTSVQGREPANFKDFI